MRSSLMIAGLGLVMALLAPAALRAADPPANASELQKLQDQVRAQDKDLSVLKEVSASRFEAQDKRISDLALATSRQEVHLGAISNQTATVGNYIAVTSVLITLIVFVAGLATYISAKARAEKEAREAAAQWFKDNAAELTREIEELRKKATDAADAIDKRVAQITARAEVAEQTIADAQRVIMESASRSPLGVSAAVIDQSVIKVVQQASEELKKRAETSFSSEDHYTRGVAHFATARFDAALESFNAALALPGAGGDSRQHARHLFAKGVTLGQLKRSEEAIAVYDEIDRRYGKDEAAGVREQVAKGLVNKGFTLGQLKRSEEAIAVYDEIDRRYGKDEAADVREQVAKGLFNKGATLGQLDRSEEAIAVYDEIDRRYGKDEAAGVREHVARGLNGSAFNRMMLAKVDWAEPERRTPLLAVAIAALERGLTCCGKDARATLLGNLGYARFLIGARQEARVPTLECLQLGGQKALDAQREDSSRHRVEPEDTQYEALLDELWASLKPPGDGAASA